MHIYISKLSTSIDINVLKMIKINVRVMLLFKSNTRTCMSKYICYEHAIVKSVHLTTHI
jgi:hypothetical protein